ncbi:MAG: GGDEF domain-containing protein [Myxococcota bacterium]|jgi:GGDEF domain-containing protein
MPKRPLFVLSTNADVVAACNEAAKLAGNAVAEVHVCNDHSKLSSGNFDGLVVVDPEFMAPLSIHEFTLDFLHKHRALLFLLTSGDVQHADGLARFVGAQAAIAMPVVASNLAEHLASPFGVPANLRPDPLPIVDTAALSKSIGDILKGREPQSRERFLKAVADPETGLHTPEFWQHRLEEEFKRSARFRFPLGLVSFNWEGEVGEEVLLELSGLLLLDTRDVDVAAHVADHSLVAMLPHTGPEGTRMFAQRVMDSIAEHKLVDLLGEPLEMSSATAVAPDSSLSSATAFLAQVLPRQDSLENIL